MASDINRITIIGRMTADAIGAASQGGTNYVRFSIAANYYAGKDKPDAVIFVKVTAWGKLSEIISKYGHKGMRVCVDGSLQRNEWTDKDGKKHDDVFINASGFQMLEAKKDGVAPSGAAPSPASGGQPANKADVAATYNDDEVPF
jgi:single-strand DNA-binding protein